MRPSGRQADELRAIRFVADFTKHAEGSVLVVQRTTPGQISTVMNLK